MAADHLVEQPGALQRARQTARLMDMPVSKVKAIPHGDRRRLRRQDPRLSGACGRGLCRSKSGQPVKMTMQRNEVFEATGPTPGSRIRVKLGAKKDGTLIAARGLAGLRGWRRFPARR